jgi:hypothetical protein
VNWTSHLVSARKTAARITTLSPNLITGER